jgi:CelD/BcsL family acetyltransferase involved in cellulose biosynthesis
VRADSNAARLIPLEELTRGQEAAWRDLAVRAAEPNPFFEPDAVLAAYVHLRPCGAALLVVEEDGDWIGCLPVRRVRLGGMVGALRSWCHLYAFLGTPLLDREQPDAAFSALLRAAVSKPGARYIALDQLHTEGIVDFTKDAMAASGLVIVLQSTYERAALKRREHGCYRDHLGRHHERELRRLWHRLEQMLAAPLELIDRSQDADAVGTFLALEASGWKGRTGTAMASVDAHAAFFRELCARFRSTGRLQLLALEAGGRTVAMKCNLAAGEGLFCFKIGHDERLRQFSPGVQLERLNTDRFHEQRHENWMDSCAAPDNQMINRLWPDRRTLTNAVVGQRALSTALSTPAMRTAHSLRGRGIRTLRTIRGKVRK